MDNICITGGSGFIGSHLSKALPEAHLFNYPEDDLRSDGDCADFIVKYQPEYIFHLAAISTVTQDDDLTALSTNVNGTYNLLHACKLYANRLKSFVHISTDKVYGCNGDAKRSDPLKANDHPYHTSKACGDMIAQMYSNFYGLPVRIIRTGNIYGEGDNHLDRIVPNVITETLQGRRKVMRSNGKFIRDYIYIDDLIPAYIRIADEPPGIYNLGGEYHSVIDVVKMITRLMNREDLEPTAGNTQHNEILFQHVVDCPDWWKPQTTFEDGLRKTIEWYRQRYS